MRMSDKDARYEECELGEDVTHMFRSKEHKATAVLPVSLEQEELAHLENVARKKGITIFQAIHEAIAAYQPETKAVTGQR